MGITKKLLDKLLCPECHTGKLKYEQRTPLMYCNVCNTQFPIVHSIPVLVRLNDLPGILEHDQNRQTTLPKSIKSSQGSWGLYHWNIYGFSELMPSNTQGNELLAFGCGAGDDRAKIEELGFNVVGFDIYRSPGTDLLCDGHNLPFDDESFDVVLSSQVLEHLQAPWLAVAEIERVLRPGGVFVGSVAFLKPYHSSYFHITHEGLQLLLTNVGMRIDHVHAAQSVLWSIILEMLPFRFPAFLRRWCEVTEDVYWDLRCWVWALRNRADPKQPHPRFGDDPPHSYEQHHRIRFAPAVVFRARKEGTAT